MADDAAAALIPIGALARLTGLPVRTLRFYSDSGLLAPAGRSQAGYRLYDAGATTRAQLVRTLRELGVDLPTIKRVLDREVSLGGVAAAHAAALDAQIRVLRLQRTVLRVAAARDTTTPQEMKLMHDLARLGAAERRRIVADFVEEVFAGLDADPGIAARMRAATPELPDEPSSRQVEAWIELAELVADEDFRRRIRAMAQRSAADRAARPDGAEPAAAPAAPAAREAHARAAQVVAERAGAALAAGIDPASAAARPVVDELAAVFAELHGREDGPDFRAWLAETLETFTDRRAERYWQLLAIMNGWPQPTPAAESSLPPWEWLTAGLRA
jgi:DNA-binding transcriptional MerR regulator